MQCLYTYSGPWSSNVAPDKSSLPFINIHTSSCDALVLRRGNGHCKVVTLSAIV